MIVPIAYYVQGEGRKPDVDIVVSDSCELNYIAIQQTGCRFTLELLPAGKMAVCIENSDFGDYDIEFANADNFVEKLETMINRFNLTQYNKWFNLNLTMEFDPEG